MGDADGTEVSRYRSGIFLGLVFLLGEMASPRHGVKAAETDFSRVKAFLGPEIESQGNLPTVIQNRKRLKIPLVFLER